MPNHANPSRYLHTCRQTLAAARQKDYAGFSKFDALNSPWLDTLTFRNKWLRILLTQGVKECPWHIRPLLGVKPSRNPKGIALFARAYLFLYQITQAMDDILEAQRLLNWLLENRSPHSHHASWGYNFIWQSPLFTQEREEPNLVVTVFAGEALLHGYRLTHNQDYLDAALSAGRFLLEEIPVLHDSPEERAIAYVMRNVKSVVLNNNILAGAFLTKLAAETQDKNIHTLAVKLLNFTVNRRTAYNAWYYTHPHQHSHLRHDNYHTGGILDGLLEFFEETHDDRYLDIYWKGLDYYRDYLFEKNGAPRWMNDQRFPHDVHGAAQGIITFTKASRYRSDYFPFLLKIADWALDNLYNPRTCEFIYRRGKWITWNYSLMRWCNAWMTRALGEMAKIMYEKEPHDNELNKSPC